MRVYCKPLQAAESSAIARAGRTFPHCHMLMSPHSCVPQTLIVPRSRPDVNKRAGSRWKISLAITWYLLLRLRDHRLRRFNTWSSLTLEKYICLLYMRRCSMVGSDPRASCPVDLIPDDGENRIIQRYSTSALGIVLARCGGLSSTDVD
jgi:hypothetical protein